MPQKIIRELPENGPAQSGAPARRSESTGPSLHARGPQGTARIARQSTGLIQGNAAIARSPRRAPPAPAFAPRDRPAQCESAGKPSSKSAKARVGSKETSGQHIESFA